MISRKGRVTAVNEQDVRWVQRFENFARACMLLSEINSYQLEDTPAIIREGFVQRFEITFDLAWKTMKDYLEYEGIKVQATPRAVIKEAFAANFFADWQCFIEMLEARNLMSHRYDEESFIEVFIQIKNNFYPALEKLRVFFKNKRI
jgi:nucleotidyltransferase substrate binding protein (TIGR01987 family)